MFGRTLTSTQGDAIDILRPGRHNDDAGPDFSDARLRINGEEWAGNVEIHVKASDWFRHGHEKDPAYNNVILHVVASDDASVTMSNGRTPLQVEVSLSDEFHTTLAQLQSSMKGVKCGAVITTVPELIIYDWLESLSVERLHFKAKRILDYLEEFDGDWEQSIFTLLARSLGFGLNGVPFEIMARNLPLRILYHHADDLFQIEALLFGQAGMLDPSLNTFDEYYQRLCTEYQFLARKYSLRPIDKSLWKYSRTRPQNFPHRRIAILAASIYNNTRFTSDLLDAGGDYDRLLDLFAWSAGGYWSNHSSFGQPDSGTSFPSILSKASRELLMINVAAPFYMAYGKFSANPEIAEKAFTILSSLPAERNSKIRMWESLGIIPDDALHSQALLHLQSNYCDCANCLNCRIGHHLLRREALPEIGSKNSCEKLCTE